MAGPRGAHAVRPTASANAETPKRAVEGAQRTKTTLSRRLQPAHRDHTISERKNAGRGISHTPGTAQFGLRTSLGGSTGPRLPAEQIEPA